MSTIKLITVCSHPENATTLVRTATAKGWDIVVIDCGTWKGFGAKLIETYNYLKQHPEVERFVFADAFDVVVLGTPEEFEEKLYAKNHFLLSMERGLWPPILHPFKIFYAQKEHGFNYANSGLYYTPSALFIKIMEYYPPSYETDDQFWLNMVWMKGNDQDWFAKDHVQSLFNSHSFIAKGEYTYNNGRVQIMGNEPVFIHSNGKTVDPKLDELVRGMLG